MTETADMTEFDPTVDGYAGTGDTVPATPSKQGPEKQPLALVAVILAILAIIAGVAYFVQSERDASGEAVTEVATPTGATQEYGFVNGNADAPVKVVVYEDLACPACKRFEIENYIDFEEAKKDGRISVESRILRFLDGDSKYSTRAFNTYLSVNEHAGADVAEEFRLALLVNQPDEGHADFTDLQLVEILKTAAGFDDQEAIANIETDQKSLRFEQWITNAADAASKAGVRGTPWVTVNGELVEDPFNALWDAIKGAEKVAEQ